ncbi:MAG TPA: gamma-glutamyltransferase [Patescibacteria group bacterium]|nr:gamma-glutamyltransferase [Patescibacteria group bacterium]
MRDSGATVKPASIRRVAPLAAFLGVFGLLAACVAVPAQKSPAQKPPASGHTAAPKPGATTSSVFAGGAVASAEPAATDAGLAVLRAGGNAADAAIATALALAVVMPNAGNLGGGGFAVVRTTGGVAALDFRETAPAAARPDMFLTPEGHPKPEASLVGPLAAAVPGSPQGLYDLHQRYGRLPWRRVVEPAISLARSGFAVTERLHHALEEEKEDLARFPATAEVWLPQGQPLATGTRLRLPALAATLAAYADRGPKALMEGPVAEAIEAVSHAGGGLLTAADLAAYRPVWREPLRFEAFGWEIVSMPLPSSGGIIEGETLLMLEALRWPSLPRGDAQRAHLLVESWRRAFADRYLLGDPATTRAEASSLLAPEWVARRVAGIDATRATPSKEIRPWPDAPAPEGRSGETTHLSVVDREGNSVALTTTLNGWFGCYVYVPEAGFFLNNEMDDFATVPDQPNLFELIQGQANAVRAGARMLSSMSPTIAWRGRETLVLGSRGGSRIPTATLQVLLNVIVDGDPLETAVNRPRFHHQWMPDEVRYEPGALDAAQRQELESRGDRLKEVTWPVGEVDAVRVGADGTLQAAADARGPGGAGVVTPP